MASESSSNLGINPSDPLTFSAANLAAASRTQSLHARVTRQREAAAAKNVKEIRAFHTIDDEKAEAKERIENAKRAEQRMKENAMPTNDPLEAAKKQVLLTKISKQRNIFRISVVKEKLSMDDSLQTLQDVWKKEYAQVSSQGTVPMMSGVIRTFVGIAEAYTNANPQWGYDLSNATQMYQTLEVDITPELNELALMTGGVLPLPIRLTMKIMMFMMQINRLNKSKGSFMVTSQSLNNKIDPTMLASFNDI
jgi:hypothetical protein